jgi:ubiquinone/menaquinone biosynthesis C-methylase UbiE
VKVLRGAKSKQKGRLFDSWPETYDRWFTTPIGALIKKVEGEVLLDFLKPARGETILDAGCGTGVFTRDICACGAKVIGIDLSRPMLEQAGQKIPAPLFQAAAADLLNLPFHANRFDKTMSVTAVEFIAEAQRAFAELFRVTRPGGAIVVATLNALSPWAARRRQEGEKGHPLFGNATFRSPAELASLAPVTGTIRTAVHFRKDDDPEKAPQMEREGREQGFNTGAFLIGRWVKPDERIEA